MHPEVSQKAIELISELRHTLHAADAALRQLKIVLEEDRNNETERIHLRTSLPAPTREEPTLPGKYAIPEETA